MFDAVTSTLIRAAPPLEGLEVDRLPELLTGAYSRIISVRLTVGGGAALDLPRSALEDDLRELRQLAHTYGALALSLDPGDERERGRLPGLLQGRDPR